MKHKVTWIAALSVAALLIAGGLMASNMGFKLAYQLTTTTPANQNPIALPYNQQAGINTAKDLIDDVGASTGVTPTAMAFYNTADGFTSYAPPAPGNFDLDSGKAYLLQVPSATTYIIVGSHDPGLGVDLTTASPANQNFQAIPYHTTAVMASDLLGELGASAVAISFYNSADGFTTYAPPAPGDFAIKPGEGYLFQVTADILGHVWSHY